MSYILNGSTIRRPNSMVEDNSTQVAEQRTLSGAVGRDYFGSNKRIWILKYDTINVTDFGVINTIYQNYLTNGTAVTFQVTETNYTISLTTVHIDLSTREFTVPGSSYLGKTTLILKEA